jgi:hypothetical protein
MFKLYVLNNLKLKQSHVTIYYYMGKIFSINCALTGGKKTVLLFKLYVLNNLKLKQSHVTIYYYMGKIFSINCALTGGKKTVLLYKLQKKTQTIVILITFFKKRYLSAENL